MKLLNDLAIVGPSGARRIVPPGPAVPHKVSGVPIDGISELVVVSYDALFSGVEGNRAFEWEKLPIGVPPEVGPKWVPTEVEKNRDGGPDGTFDHLPPVLAAPQPEPRVPPVLLNAGMKFGVVKPAINPKADLLLSGLDERVIPHRKMHGHSRAWAYADTRDSASSSEDLPGAVDLGWRKTLAGMAIANGRPSPCGHHAKETFVSFGVALKFNNAFLLS